MKSKIILLVLIVQLFSHGYELMDSWLATPGSYQVYLTHEVDSLKSAWGLNFSSCISAANAHSVTDTPVLDAASGTSENANCIVKYEPFTKPQGAVAICTRDSLGEYFSFTIVVNELEYNPTTYGIYNINSIITHELVHSLGLADNSDPTTLMYGTAGTITNLTNDEINGIKNVYEIPVIQILSPCIVSGDTLKVIYKNETDSVEFRVTTPSMLAHNSVVPPDISLAGFFTDLANLYTGKEANFDSLGNSVYNYKTNIKVLEDYMESDIFKFRTYNKRNFWAYGNYWSNNSPSGEGLLKITPKPTNESPIPGSMYNVSPRGKGSVTDTLEIKVRVPEVLGSYPAINIKIDGVYVNPGDIVFDSTENLWIYYWDLSTVNPTEYGRRYTITSEIEDDPTSYDATGVYLVEALFYEDFQVITDLTAAGWAVSSYEYPVQTYTGWWIGNDELDPVNQCSKSLAFVNSTAMAYRLYSPAFTVPSDPDAVTKLEYKLYLNISSLPKSLIKFYICNASNTTITPALELNQYAIDGSWVNLEYDLSEFAGQTIKLHWNNYYNSTTPCKTTTYQLDDILVYTIPDMEGPNIDFVAGNTAEPNEDMNLNIGFNDNSGISSVTADYSIEGDNNTISLYPVKGTYNYTGTIQAKDHECSGLISFKIKDSVGNETVSSGHGIYWSLGGGVLTAPQNVVISALNDSTVSVSWDLVDGATGYKVFSSTDPYGTFTEDSTGTFTESRVWQKTTDGNKYFYYVIATNPTKFDLDAIKEEEYEIAVAGENK